MHKQIRNFSREMKIKRNEQVKMLEINAQHRERMSFKNFSVDFTRISKPKVRSTEIVQIETKKEKIKSGEIKQKTDHPKSVI